MSSEARVLIGLLTLVSALLFALIGVTLGGQLPAGGTPFYGMAAFCAVISLACFSNKSQPVTLRIIGAILCCSYFVYAVDSFGSSNFVIAVIGFIVIGVPGGYLMIVGKYPQWGEGSSAFSSRSSRGSSRRKNNRRKKPRRITRRST